MQVGSTNSSDINKFVASFVEKIKTDQDFLDNIEYIKQKEKYIERFIEEGKTNIEPKNQLVVLRKWNSYTPILPPENSRYVNKGGGYFMKIGDIGIVIDPGFNFVENFLNAGFRLDDIDHIFISHAHNDHTVELEAIFSLLYKRNKKAEDQNKKAGNNNFKMKKIKLYMNLGTFKKFSGYFDLSNPEDKFYIEDICILSKHQYIKISDGIEVFTTEAKHHEMITKSYSLGFTFVLNLPGGKKVVKFTSDTGWDEEIEKRNKNLALDFTIDGIDLLILHTGSIKEKELKDYNTSKSINENKDALYEYHLGLIGTVASIHLYNPTITLISEFGEEMNAIRHKVSGVIENLMKKRHSQLTSIFV